MVALHRLAEIRPLGVLLAAKPSGRARKIAEPFLYLRGRQSVALDIAEPRCNVGVDSIAGIAPGLAVPLEPRQVFIEALADGVGAAPDFAAIVARQMGKPLPSGLLRLSEGQDVRLVGVRYVIGRAD